MQNQSMNVKNGDLLKDSVSGLELLVVNTPANNFSEISVDGRNLDLVEAKMKETKTSAVFTAKRD